MKHTKIVCTIGPASNSKTTLERMISAGMNVARLNFSHGTHEEHAKLIHTIQAAATRKNTQVALLQDLQGPRIRVGELPEEGVHVRHGDKVVLLSQTAYKKFQGEAAAVPIQFDNLYKSLKKGSLVTIQDGIIELTVDSIQNKEIHATTRQGGTIHSHKGINAPGVTVDAQVITAKDKKDIAFGQKMGVDYVALSFVKDAKDIEQLRRLLGKTSRTKIIAKIERAEAIENFEDILAAVDGIMIARGDLGVEVGTAKVPLLQKAIIEACVDEGKPVIVATQMLESMTQTPRPTRAEAADVANAVIDHADAVMLSAESATGNYPVKSVQTMTDIIKATEQSTYDDFLCDPLDPEMYYEHAAAVGLAHSAIGTAETMDAKVLVLCSDNLQHIGFYSQLRSQDIKLLICTHNESISRQISLLWGVELLSYEKKDISRDQVTRLLKKERLIKKGETCVLVSHNEKQAHQSIEITTI